MKKYLVQTALPLVALIFFCQPPSASAIPPPDIVVSITQSFLGIFGIMIAFVIAGFYTIKDIFFAWKNKKKTKK